ncbi:MAG: xanthine permease [Oscillospiraceae bacterium]|nr:xanthine permease [Oscillospiraceae bacterium]
MKENVLGYLPNERPTTWRLLLYALQQVVVMFPATVTVALITGFQVSTTIFASGLATLCFVFITEGKIPLYYGSSFSYLTAVAGLVTSQGIMEKLSPEAAAQVESWAAHTSAVLPTEAVQYAQFGIVMSGLVSIAAGLLIRLSGPKAVENILPPTITGPVAMIIGLTLAGNAMKDAYTASDTWQGGMGGILLVSLSTLLSTILFSRYLKGFLGQLPLLLGAGVGCIVAFVVYLVGGSTPASNLFDMMSVEEVVAASTWKLGNGSFFALPAFSLPKFSLEAIIAIMPVAIATIPESTAHMYQLDVYVNNLAEQKGKEKIDFIKLLDRNLVGDGLCDMIAGVIGGPAGTNYGENISTMAITKVFSTSVLLVASVIAMIVSCFTPLISAIYAIPTAVIGGLEIYLFGAIAAQGIAIMIDKQCDMFSSKNIAVIATIMVVGLGGQYYFGGNIPFPGFSGGIPCIAGAAVSGILLNLLLSIGEKKD